MGHPLLIFSFLSPKTLPREYHETDLQTFKFVHHFDGFDVSINWLAGLQI